MGNANEVGQIAEFLGSLTKAAALFTPKMTRQARQSWIEMPPAAFARVLEELVFLPCAPAGMAPSQKIAIDRSTPFNPATFIGKGWTIAEEDERALALTEVDLSAVHFDTTLRNGEGCVRGEERLRRLKAAGHIRLDAKIFQILWENQHLIPESWKEKTNGNTTYVFFDGTILRNPSGGRCALYLYWDVDRWHWFDYWLDVGWVADNPSAVLAS